MVLLPILLRGNQAYERHLSEMEEAKVTNNKLGYIARAFPEDINQEYWQIQGWTRSLCCESDAQLYAKRMTGERTWLGSPYPSI